MTLGPSTKIASVMLYADMLLQFSLHMYASSSNVVEPLKNGGQHSMADEIHVKAIQHWHLFAFKKMSLAKKRNNKQKYKKMGACMLSFVYSCGCRWTRCHPPQRKKKWGKGSCGHSPCFRLYRFIAQRFAHGQIPID